MDEFLELTYAAQSAPHRKLHDALDKKCRHDLRKGNDKDLYRQNHLLSLATQVDFKALASADYLPSYPVAELTSFAPCIEDGTF